ncbi:hypothetical protein D9757_007245 [Collybiopsis confluens]|uniref:DUF6532 domain-containing protein n=1 Tax=Collybiopsis confluens TaxID=2823264 RepID=A0A8H5HAQ5_9AGAR|nr:hypothetical protein D9757_007245 [Collybiopsis confluens]
MAERRRQTQSRPLNDSLDAPPHKKSKNDAMHLQPPNSRSEDVASRSQTAAQKLPGRNNSKDLGPDRSLNDLGSFHPVYSGGAALNEDVNKPAMPPLNAQEEKYLLQFRNPHQSDSYLRHYHDGSLADKRSPDPGDDGEHDEVDVGGGAEEEEDDEVIVRNVTRPQNIKKVKSSQAKGKVLLKVFDCQDLAQYARRCVRYATCMLDMFPDNDMFAWDIFEDDLAEQNRQGKGNGIRLYKALRALDDDAPQRKNLITYMNYGTSSVRYSFAQDARIRVVDYYGLSQLDGASKSNLINWLTTGYRFHYDINLKERTEGEHPFFSPLISQVLRGYLVDGKPRLDHMLVKEIYRSACVPLRVIALVVVSIYHSLHEHSSGNKNSNDISRINLEGCYTDLVAHLEELQDKSPEYCNLLQERLYKNISTKSRVVTPSHFDYGALTAFAREEKRLEEEEEEYREEARKKEARHKRWQKGKGRNQKGLSRKGKERGRTKKEELERKAQEAEEARRAGEKRSIGAKKKVLFQAVGRKAVVDVDLSMGEEDEEEMEETVEKLFDSGDEESAEEELLSRHEMGRFGYQEDDLMGSDGQIPDEFAEGIDGGITMDEEKNTATGRENNGLVRNMPGRSSLPSIEVIDEEVDEEEVISVKGELESRKGQGVGGREAQKLKPLVNPRRSTRNKTGDSSSGPRVIMEPRLISGTRPM